jgi:hypothetical protein
MGLVVANADLDLSVNDWLNLGFVKVAGRVEFYIRERAKKNRYCRAVF